MIFCRNAVTAVIRS